MIKLWRNKHLRAFTLIELLVVIAIIAILAAILVPAVSDALLRGRMTQVMSNGKNIYTALFAKEMEDAVFMRVAPYPTKGASEGSPNISNMWFASSTDYLRWVVTGGVMNVSMSFFAAPGVVPASDSTNFAAANNAWCVVSGIGEGTADGTPLLFTRNLNITTLGDADVKEGGTIANVMPTTSKYGAHDNTPFQDKAMVVVFKGGAAFALRQKDVIENFNKLGATNEVLRPSTTY
jgi:prepilin-type N-terminal cleavage/methylation domain-containing protein